MMTSQGSSSAGKPAVPVTQADIINTFKGMRSELQRLSGKVGSLEAERDEHKLVIESLKPLEPERKCYRLMNGVMVERTVKDVLPQLEQNIANIDTVIGKLLEGYKLKEKELVDFQQKYQIRVEAGQQSSGSIEEEEKASNNVALA